jgi:hypothetical protein
VGVNAGVEAVVASREGLVAGFPVARDVGETVGGSN